MEDLTSQILSLADSSFKYILIAFNFMTLIVVYIHKNKQKIKKQHHVLFVTAHPDDQVMFFRPSISSITKEYFVHLLCLTGKQTQRQNELKNSVQKFGIHKYQCLNNQKLIDSMTSAWPKEQIQSIVLKYVKENNIKAIFTFDNYGVSGHLNHKSIAYALQDLEYPKNQLKVLNKKIQSLNSQQKQQVQRIQKQSIKIYHLRSVNLIRKYTGFFQIIFALLRDYSWVNLNIVDAYLSMSIHKTQFAWYRKLWVFFSQYNFINVFKMTRVKVNQQFQQKNIEKQNKIKNNSEIIQNLKEQKKQK